MEYRFITPMELDGSHSIVHLKASDWGAKIRFISIEKKKAPTHPVSSRPDILVISVPYLVDGAGITEEVVKSELCWILKCEPKDIVISVARGRSGRG